MGDSIKKPIKECDIQTKDTEQEEAPKLEEVIEPIIISKDLPDEAKVQQIIQIMKVSQESFSGPIPHPQLLKGYKDIISDAPERILQMAEKELDHRIYAENEMLAQNRCNIEGSVCANKRSQIFAFILVSLLIIVGTLLIYWGYEKAGATIFGTTIIAVAAIFITGKIKQGNKDSNKEELPK